ncbi:MAG TPA: Gfo/Idh/MocA family oxidoreductase [Anaerolineaceae bacterium]
MQNLAILGGSHIHTPNFVRMLQERKDIQVLWVWDPRPPLAEKLAAELNGRSASLETILGDQSITSVVICSETFLHKDLVLSSASAGKNIFVEKPLGIGSADAFAMANAVKQAGIIFQTGFFNRGNPVYRFLKEEITLGHFGKITRIRGVNAHQGGLAGWFVDKDWSWMTDLNQAGCGAFGDLGAHALDILLWLVGYDVEQVIASIKVATGRYGITDEYGEGMLEFSSGIIGSLAAGWVDVRNPVKLEISGTEGHAALIDQKLYYKSSHLEGANGEVPWENLPAPLPHAFQLFLDAITGTPHLPLVKVEEAALQSAIMEAFYQSSKANAWVRPSQLA